MSRKHIEDLMETLDVGVIRGEVVDILKSKGHDVQQEMDIFVINGKVEIRMTDTVIKELTASFGASPTEITGQVLAQYDYLMSQEI